jgi:hypothetical protein
MTAVSAEQETSPDEFGVEAGPAAGSAKSQGPILSTRLFRLSAM